MLIKQQKRYRRHQRVRSKIKGVAKLPRLCVFRSSKHIYAQLIDDEKGKTLIAIGDFKSKVSMRADGSPSHIGKSQKSKIQSKSQKLEKDEKTIVRSGKIAKAYEIGKALAEKAKEKKIEKVVFDRGGYKYHGRVRALAEGAREGGLKF